MSLFKSNLRNSMKRQFLESLMKGLDRSSITACSQWTEKYRIMRSELYTGYWNFKWYPWLRAMHDSKAEFNVCQKAAQIGVTETLLNIAFFHIDVKISDVLYLLPSRTPDASDFSSARFDAALELSPYLGSLFEQTKNIGHKRAGSANFYLRGARSRSGLKSIPISLLIMDEINEMPEENIPLALERTSGQIEKSIWMVSTPTLEEFGVSKYYNRSSQNLFFFKCPSCNRYDCFQYPDSLIIVGEHISDPRIKESHYICTYCKAILPQEDKINFLNENSKWIQSYSDRDIEGWHVSQLYSLKIKPSDIAISYFSSLQDSTEEQEFYNSKLGVPHEVKGSRITDSDIYNSLGGYLKKSSIDYGIITMGVDVGYPFIHYEIDEWQLPSYMSSEDLNHRSRCKMISYGKLNDVEQLDDLMRKFMIRFCVIDAHPERRKAFEFALRFWGHVRLAFYSVGITGKQIHLSDKNDEPTLSVDRTSWLDLSLGRFKSGTITIPSDTDLEYKAQIKSPVRQYKKDRTGNPIGEYVNVVADHYAHARNYAEIALPLAVSLAESISIPSSVL